MKKLLSLMLAFALIFSFCSCSKKVCLYELVISLTIEDDTLNAGHVMCYGHMHENSMSDDTLSEYLGLEGYPEFKNKIEELAVYSSIGNEYLELAAMKLYSSCDLADGVLFFERRIKSAKRAGMFGMDTSAADSAYISVYGNTVVLYMMRDNKSMQSKVGKAIN